MDCNHIKLPDGGFAIVCSRGRRTPRCRWCERTPGVFQCDWKVAEGKTCDKHICPEHQKAYKDWLAAREAAP